MEIFDSSKTIIENAYYASGVIIAVAAIIGIYQIFIMKRGININSRRDAAKVSFQISEIYDSKFKQCIDLLVEAYKKIELEVIMKINIEQFSIQEYKVKYEEAWRTKFETNYKKVAAKFEECANILEGYSVPILLGVADENISFNTEYECFILLSKICFPYIINKQIEDKQLFCYTSKLYNLWIKKSTKLKLQNEIEKLEEKLQNTKIKKDIEPIGTK